MRQTAHHQLALTKLRVSVIIHLPRAWNVRRNKYTRTKTNFNKNGSSNSFGNVNDFSFSSSLSLLLHIRDTSDQSACWPGQGTWTHQGQLSMNHLFNGTRNLNHSRLFFSPFSLPLLSYRFKAKSAPSLILNIDPVSFFSSSLLLVFHLLLLLLLFVSVCADFPRFTCHTLYKFLIRHT